MTEGQELELSRVDAASFISLSRSGAILAGVLQARGGSENGWE
jgi:hypothetical protein